MDTINLACHKDANISYHTSSTALRAHGVSEDQIEESLENIANSYVKKGYSVEFTYSTI